MKNPFNPYFQMTRYQKERTTLVKLLGFEGYYINRFNDIVSYQTQFGRNVKVTPKRQGNRVYDTVQLYDDEGNRRLRSRRKILAETLGQEEFAKREMDRYNRLAILDKEELQSRLDEEREVIENQIAMKVSQRKYDEYCALEELY
jgi:hypothetical protein